VDGHAPLFTRPLLAAVADPGQVLGDVQPAAGRIDRREAVVPHPAHPLGHALVALVGAEVGVAAPEVLPGQVAGGHLDALVPAVVAGPVAGDQVAGEGAQRVDVGLAGLVGVGV